ncbi:unnamed protein product, partial [marine sediment metagenome]
MVNINMVDEFINMPKKSNAILTSNNTTVLFCVKPV